MIVLQLFTGERVMVNETNIDCVKEIRDPNGTYHSQVFSGKLVLKVRQTFEEIAHMLAYEGVAMPVYSNVERSTSPPDSVAKKTPLGLEDKFRRS